MKPALLDHVSRTIRERRIERNIPQGTLAKMIGTSRQSINGYEKGHFLPQVQIMLKLAVLLDIDLNALKEIK